MIVRPDGYRPVDIHECAAGDMPLAPGLDKKLTAKIADTPVEPLAGKVVKETIKPWYCPRCRQPMFTRNASSLEKVCAHCSLILEPGIVYELVELHPHKNSNGGWS